MCLSVTLALKSYLCTRLRHQKNAPKKDIDAEVLGHRKPLQHKIRRKCPSQEPEVEDTCDALSAYCQKYVSGKTKRT